MKKLASLVGKWSGEGTVVRGPGDPMSQVPRRTAARSRTSMATLPEGERWWSCVEALANDESR